MREEIKNKAKCLLPYIFLFLLWELGNKNLKLLQNSYIIYIESKKERQEKDVSFLHESASGARTQQLLLARIQKKII